MRRKTLNKLKLGKSTTSMKPYKLSSTVSPNKSKDTTEIRRQRPKYWTSNLPLWQVKNKVLKQKLIGCRRGLRNWSNRFLVKDKMLSNNPNYRTFNPWKLSELIWSKFLKMYLCYYNIRLFCANNLIKFNWIQLNQIVNWSIFKHFN